MKREPSTFEQWLEAQTGTVSKWDLQWVVCPACQGEGRYVNPSIDSEGISAEEWSEWTPDSREAYLSGGYDVACQECNGNNVVQRLRPDAPPNLLHSWEWWEQDEWNYQAEVAAERRMGA